MHPLQWIDILVIYCWRPSVRDTDDFKMNGYDSVRNEFSVWLDSLACIFAKFDNYSSDLSFFQSESGKPGEWFSRALWEGNVNCS